MAFSPWGSVYHRKAKSRKQKAKSQITVRHPEPRETAKDLEMQAFASIEILRRASPTQDDGVSSFCFLLFAFCFQYNPPP
jgi:hypothetical protein